MKVKKHLLTASILILAGSSAAVSQSKVDSANVLSAQAPAVAEVLQTPETPQTPQVWSLTTGGGENYLGVYTESINSENQNAYGLREARGVGVSKVAKDSPAEKAGLQKDDVILRFDNETVTSIRKLNRLIDESEPNQTVQLTISRHGAEQQLSVKLGKRSDATARLLQMMPPKWDNDGNRPFGDGGIFNVDPKNMPQIYQIFGPSRRIGVATSPLSKQLAEYFGARDGGVLVSTVNEGSPAAKAGLRAGDVVTEVNGIKVSSSSDLIQEIGKKKEGEVTLTIIRDKNQRTIKVTPEANANPADLKLFDWPQVGEIAPPLLQQLATPEFRIAPDVRTLVVPQPKALPRVTIPPVQVPVAPDPPGLIL